MSKELDELERGIVEFEKELEDDCNNEWLKRVVAGMKKCYQRLEAIENANPSEALEELFKTTYFGSKEEYDKINNCYNSIKQALLKAQEQGKALIEIVTIMDTWATSKLISDEIALNQISNILKEMVPDD